MTSQCDYRAKASANDPATRAGRLPTATAPAPPDWVPVLAGATEVVDGQPEPEPEVLVEADIIGVEEPMALEELSGVLLAWGELMTGLDELLVGAAGVTRTTVMVRVCVVLEVWVSIAAANGAAASRRAEDATALNFMVAMASFD